MGEVKKRTRSKVIYHYGLAAILALGIFVTLNSVDSKLLEITLIIMVVLVFSLIIGLYKPDLVIIWGDKEKKTKKNVLKYCGLSLLVSFIVLLMVVPPITEDRKQELKIEKQLKQEARARDTVIEENEVEEGVESRKKITQIHTKTDLKEGLADLNVDVKIKKEIIEDKEEESARKKAIATKLDDYSEGAVGVVTQLPDDERIEVLYDVYEIIANTDVTKKKQLKKCLEELLRCAEEYNLNPVLKNELLKGLNELADTNNKQLKKDESQKFGRYTELLDTSKIYFRDLLVSVYVENNEPDNYLSVDLNLYDKLFKAAGYTDISEDTSIHLKGTSYSSPDAPKHTPSKRIVQYYNNQIKVLYVHEDLVLTEPEVMERYFEGMEAKENKRILISIAQEGLKVLADTRTYDRNPVLNSSLSHEEFTQLQQVVAIILNGDIDLGIYVDSAGMSLPDLSITIDNKKLDFTWSISGFTLRAIGGKGGSKYDRDLELLSNRHEETIERESIIAEDIITKYGKDSY